MLLEEDTRDKAKLREQIKHVEFYLMDKKNVTVIFGRDEENAYCDVSKYITINTCQNLRSQLHSLFHEAGHALLRSNRKRFEQKYPEQTTKRRNSKSFKLSVLKEEIVAWERGYKLATTLGIDLDEKWWKKHNEECIYDYVKWVING
jgi:hypothetical protein